MIITTVNRAAAVATSILKIGGNTIQADAHVINISGRSGARVFLNAEGVATIVKTGISRTDNEDGSVTLGGLSVEWNKDNRVTLY